MILQLSFLLCYLTAGLASHCYSNICHNKTVHWDNSEPQCLITPVQRGKDCVNLRFENLGLAPFGSESLGKFRLSAYVKDFGEFDGRTTAFNLSISDIKFNRLITRYQDSSNDRHAACREIDIYGNEDNIQFPEIFVSCPFEEETFEAIPYHLEYLAVGQSFEYSRKLVFTVPRHLTIDEDSNDVTTFIPFFYIDVSNTATLLLHIQPLPEKFNVTQYIVWLMNNDTNSVVKLELKRDHNKEIQHNFTVPEGIYHFKVAALHPMCQKNGCINATSPIISTKQPTRRLLIMIISVIWIPPVILYALYYAYKLYMRNALSKRQHHRPNCLLVYSPTHVAHVDVMQKLAFYLRSCNINAMIDCLDIPRTENKDPGLWCNSAFRNADVIIVATSPPPSDSVVPIIYHNMDSHALRLIKENYARRNKKYFVIQMPYCHHDDLPEEAKLFRRFDMPHDLEELVKNIFVANRLLMYGVSNKEFVGSIKRAKTEIGKEKRETKNTDKNDSNLEANLTKSTNLITTSEISDKATTVETNLTEVLLPSVTEEKVKKDDDYEKKQEVEKQKDDTKNCQYFGMNIDELDLLGENGESETFIYKPTKNNDDFCIDELDL